MPRNCAPSKSPSSRAINDLSPRERETLDWLSEGLSNKDIARRMNISVNTTKYFVAAIFRKLGVNNRTQATMLAASSPDHLGAERSYAQRRRRIGCHA